MIAQNIFFDFRDIFKQFNVSNNVNYALIKNDAFFRRNHSRTDRSYKINSKQMRETNQILQNDFLKLKKKRLTWKQLITEMKTNVIDDTMKHIMQTVLNYEKCLICVNDWLTAASMNKRLEWTITMLNKYLKNENWNRVRFNDEIHFFKKSKKKLRIIRKSDTRYKWNCIQHRDSSAAKNEKRMHCWIAIDYNFKSNIIFYNVPGNSNEKMTHDVYVNFIFDFVIKSWLNRKNDFVNLSFVWLIT